MENTDKPLFSREDLNRLIKPLLVEQTLAVTIGLMDTVMVSSCGEASVSGVSLVDAISILLIQVFAALATGGAVVVSQYLGKGDRDTASQAATHLYAIVLGISSALMLLCVPLRNALLASIFGAIEADVMEAAQTYFLLTALSYPFLAMYNAGAALLRAMGDARASMRTSVVMNLVNVAGNAITIYLLGMGVAGAGLATLLSRIVGAVIIQLPLRQPSCLIRYPSLRRLRWQGGLARKILSVGIPNGLENGLFQLGKLALVRMITLFGTVSITANAVGNTWGTIHALPGNAVSLAMITVIGRCCGAHAFDQARMYTRRLMRLAYLLMGALNIAILLINPWVGKPFNLSAETEQLTRIIVAIHGAGCVLLWPMAFIFPNSLRAAGDATYTMAVSVFSMLAFRLVFGWLLAIPAGLGVVGVWIAMQIDWVFRITMFVLRYRSGKWMSKALV